MQIHLPVLNKELLKAIMHRPDENTEAYLKQWNYLFLLLRRIKREVSQNSKDNYRPMSIKKKTKIFEKIMYNQMVIFIDKLFNSFNQDLEKPIVQQCLVDNGKYFEALLKTFNVFLMGCFYNQLQNI